MGIGSIVGQLPRPWKRDSPFYLRPRPAVLPWLARFALAARHAGEGAAVIRELSIASLELHAQLGAELDTSFERTGTLNVYATPASLEAGAREGERSGLRFDVLDADETPRARAVADRPVAGSVRYPDESAGRPEALRRGGRPGSGRGRRRDPAPASRSTRSTSWTRRRSSSQPARGAARSSTSRSRAGRATTSTTSAPRAIPASRPGCRRPGRSRRRCRAGCGSRGRSSSPGSTSRSRSRASTRSGAAASGGSAASASGRLLDVWAGLRPCLPDGLPAIGRLGRASSPPVTR